MRAIVGDDLSGGEERSRLRLIEAEVERLSAMIERVALRSGPPLHPNRSIANYWNESSPATSFARGRAQIVREKIRQRRLRERHFVSELFAEPAWDMLLDLYAAHYEGVAVSVSSLCIAAAVPATTALRWIKIMVDDGHFVRSQDPADGRRIFIRISDDARARMDDYFDEVGG